MGLRVPIERGRVSFSLSLSFSLSRLDVKRSRSSGNAFHECRNGWKYHRYRELVENSFFFFHVHKSPRTSDLIYRSRSFTFGDRERKRERERERERCNFCVHRWPRGGCPWRSGPRSTIYRISYIKRTLTFAIGSNTRGGRPYWIVIWARN